MTQEAVGQPGFTPVVRRLASRWGVLWLRVAALVALLIVELLLLYRLYNPVSLSGAVGGDEWMRVNTLIKDWALAIASPPTAIVLCTLLWTRFGAIFEAWREDAQRPGWLWWLAANAGVFAALLPGTLLLAASFEQATAPPWALFALWLIGVVALLLTFAFALASPGFWLKFIGGHALSIVFAIAAGVLVLGMSALSQGLWLELAGWTMHAAAGLLNLYEPSVAVDAPARVVAVGDFSVLINPACSGYEGMGLVTGVMAVFIWAFRSELRFPNTLLLFPIGIVAIWCLNVVRIAALASLGAHVSPELAVNGFHSQAGWLMFLVVSIGLMFAAYQISFFRPASREAQGARDARNSGAAAAAPFDASLRQVCAYLLPFIAILVSGIIARAFAVNAQSLYPLSVVAAAAVMWPFRDVYLGLIAKPQAVAVLAGLAVGVGWIATDPNAGAPSNLGVWLATLPPWAAVGWISFRVIGTSVFIPIAEELAFRGYLHRVLIARRFEQVAPGQFALHAFVITTVLFALMHGRWLSAGIAGAIYALVMYRSNRISDAIVAHMVSNAVIAAWAIWRGQWSLL